jgi:hypothetical protein
LTIVLLAIMHTSIVFVVGLLVAANASVVKK